MGPNPAGLVSLKGEKRYRHTQRKDHRKTQGEEGHLQARRESSEETNSADALIWTSSPQNYAKIKF